MERSVIILSRLVRLAAASALAVLLLSPAMASSAKLVDLNTASVEQLTELPGIGPAKAAAIVKERRRAPFASVEELDRVSGIGPKLLAELQDQITVSGAEGK